MTDQSAPAQAWWKTLILGLTPSLNQCLIVAVTAVASIAGTIATQRVTAKPVDPPKAPAPVIERVERPVDMTPIAAKLDDILKRLEAIEQARAKRKKKSVP